MMLQFASGTWRGWLEFVFAMVLIVAIGNAIERFFDKRHAEVMNKLRDIEVHLASLKK